MKKMMILAMLAMTTIASFGHKRVSETATVVGDTIYYAANHISVGSPAEASYYRLLMTQNNGIKKENVFKDYYMDGTLKAEGGYAFVDLGNDANTQYDGDITTYYPNGKEKLRGKYVDGKRDGYFTLQMRNGDIAVIEYQNGVSKHNFFMVTKPNGEQQKRPLNEIRTLLQ